MKQENRKITTIFPLFTWKVCQVCEQECSRQHLWQIEEEEKDVFFVCKKCKPTEYVLTQYLKHSKDLTLRLSNPHNAKVITK